MKLANLKGRFLVFFSSDKGATAVEYGLIVALIALMVIAGATLIGTNLDTLFNDVAGHL